YLYLHSFPTRRSSDLWIVVHTFKLGGEWVFIQRFLAVKSPKDARKSAYLLGILYLVSPVIWMLPAMIYRIVDPNANPEQAYFLRSEEHTSELQSRENL